MIDKRVNVVKRLKDYKDTLEFLEKEADDKAYYARIRIADPENIGYFEGKAAAYRIALALFKEYLEKIVIKKERRSREWV